MNTAAGGARPLGKRPLSPVARALSQAEMVTQMRGLLLAAGGGATALTILAEAVASLADSEDLVVRDQVEAVVKVIYDRAGFTAAAVTKRAKKKRTPAIREAGTD